MNAFILKYKKYLIGIAVAIAIVFTFNWYVGNKEEAAYQAGFQSANVQWEKKGKEYVAMIDDAHAKNSAMNYTLKLLTEGKIIEEQRKRDNVVQQQIEYSKSPESKARGLDDKFIKLYNDSLGE
ncbi:hypothetical protein POP15_300 [Pectobacterium phage POP15]|nr:hypothetical protein POP15_300 [Pectobacterium phage POP15]